MQAAQSAELRRLAIERGLAQIMEHPDSRAWLREHLDFCGPLRSSFTGEALSTAFAEGQRNCIGFLGIVHCAVWVLLKIPDHLLGFGLGHLVAP